MADSVGQIGLDLVVNQNGFNKQMQGITGLAKKAGAALAAAFAVKKIVDFGAQCIELGSDLTEVQNVVDVTFTQMSSKVNEFAKSAATSFGLSETMAKKYVGTFGAMAKAFGFSEGAAYDMSTTLTGLAGDVASFYNLSQDEAYTKLKSVFTGETETLKDLGVVMTQAALDQYALANGYGKTTAKMSEAEKVALRYAFVTKQLSLASGDFIRTSDSWANQVKVLQLQFESLKATIGQGLINLFTPIIQQINLFVSKLQVAADAFKSFTELITGKKSQSSSSGAASVAADASAATDNINGMADATKKAAKAAKNLSGIDELNNISSSGSGSGAGNSSGSIDTGVGSVGDMTSNTEDAANSMTEALDKVKAKLNELKKMFTNGFKLGLGDVNFDEILSHISNIGKSLKDIFLDPDVLSAADSWAVSVITSFGKITGSAASIGLTVIEFFAGSIDKYLEQNKDFIKEKLISLFNISADIRKIVSDFTVAFADIFTVFRGDNAKQIGADLIAIFNNSILSTTELAAKLGRDVMNAITKPIIDNKDKIKTALDNTLGVISEIVGGIKDYLSNIFESIHKSYDNYIAPALDKFSSGFGKVFEAVLDAYNEYLSPTIKNIAEKIRELINGPFAEVIQKFTDFTGKLIDGVATIWDETLAPFIAWIVKNLAPIFSNALGKIGDLFVSVSSTVSTVTGDILDALGGLIDFVVGVFTGDWKKAWEGIKTFFSGIIKAIKDLVSPIGAFFKTQFDNAYANVKGAFTGIKTWFQNRYNDITGIFKNIPDWFKSKFTEAWTNVKNVFSTGGKIFDGIKDGIAETFRTVVNGLISGINKIIKTPFEKINSMLNTIRDVSVLGFTPFKSLWSSNPLPIPQIPALAQGGYVKANTPQLAMIGDNKTQGEIVAPEGKLLELLKAAVASSSGLTKEDLYNVLIQVINVTGLADKFEVSADSDGIFNIVRKKAVSYRKATGKEAFG